MALFVISHTRDTHVTRTVRSSLLIHLFFVSYSNSDVLTFFSVSSLGTVIVSKIEVVCLGRGRAAN